jgi:cytochrome c556
MRDAAAALRQACNDGNYEAAREAAGRIEKSCNACHGDYRG